MPKLAEATAGAVSRRHMLGAFGAAGAALAAPGFAASGFDSPPARRALAPPAQGPAPSPAQAPVSLGPIGWAADQTGRAVAEMGNGTITAARLRRASSALRLYAVQLDQLRVDLFAPAIASGMRSGQGKAPAFPVT